ncbi:metal-dependent hydrolase [Blastomonas marina]|uniref:metal-dependent hydrolase n=1 Tax=Blastomonas marina TaxID=1867408 RepID=UPI002AC94253|nr:metal-dependent hydrolase [Blastomonas marina]WPZ04955.1 metal-dependent hydrolase [Blastomonas marina]
MDNLTHSLVGAVIGQGGLKRKTGLAMPALIIGANLPDVDAACFLWLDGAEHLGFRRGITHGPIAWVLLPLVLAGLLYGWDRWQARRGKRPEGRLPVHFGWLYALSFIGCLTHPALDWLNVYGIRLLEPFSSRWFYGDVLFIIDVWLWAILGIGLWLSLRREKLEREWRRPAWIAGLMGLAYIGLNGLITVGSERAVRDVTGAELVIASPIPLRFWERELISTDDWFGYQINGMYRVGDKSIGDCWLDLARESNDQLDAFLFWSRAPIVVADPSGDGWLLRDARFLDSRAVDRFTVKFDQDVCLRLVTRDFDLKVTPTDPSS